MVQPFLFCDPKNQSHLLYVFWLSKALQQRRYVLNCNRLISTYASDLVRVFHCCCWMATRGPETPLQLICGHVSSIKAENFLQNADQNFDRRSEQMQLPKVATTTKLKLNWWRRYHRIPDWVVRFIPILTTYGKKCFFWRNYSWYQLFFYWVNPSLQAGTTTAVVVAMNSYCCCLVFLCVLLCRALCFGGCCCCRLVFFFCFILCWAIDFGSCLDFLLSLAPFMILCLSLLIFLPIYLRKHQQSRAVVRYRNLISHNEEPKQIQIGGVQLSLTCPSS